MNSKINEIDPDKYYSAVQVAKNGWFWSKNPVTFNLFLNSEPGLKIFKPIILDKGKVKRYRIKGSYVIDFLKSSDEKSLNINYNVK